MKLLLSAMEVMTAPGDRPWGSSFCALKGGSPWRLLIHRKTPGSPGAVVLYAFNELLEEPDVARERLPHLVLLPRHNGPEIDL